MDDPIPKGLMDSCLIEDARTEGYNCDGKNLKEEEKAKKEDKTTKKKKENKGENPEKGQEEFGRNTGGVPRRRKSGKERRK